MVAYIKIVY